MRRSLMAFDVFLVSFRYFLFEYICFDRFWSLLFFVCHSRSGFFAGWLRLAGGKQRGGKRKAMSFVESALGQKRVPQKP